MAGGDILQVNWRYAVQKGESSGEEAGAKYQLRPTCGGRRAEEEGVKKRGPKPRGQGRMSKYRRKTANARERLRMGEINTAFEKLKEKIPLPGPSRQVKCEKLTKINLLHIAINYIHALEDILETGESDVDIYPEKLIRNPFRKGQDEEVEDDEPETSDLASPAPQPTHPSSPQILSFSSQSGRMSGSSSPDSGIQEDSEPEYPDWTELSSTLDICNQQGETLDPSQEDRRAGGHMGSPGHLLKAGSVEQVGITRQPGYSEHRGLTANFGFPPIKGSPEKVTRSKPVTLTSRTHPPTIPGNILPLKRGPVELLGPPCKRWLSDAHRPSDVDLLGSVTISPTLQLEQDDLFRELNASLHPLQSLDIDFSYEDPFRVF